MTDPSTTDSGSAPEAKKKLSPKTTLLLIVGVAVLPVVLAYVAFFTGVGVPDHTVNKGLLIEARSLEDLVDDSVWQRIQEEKKWRLLLPVGASCNEQCRNNLYTTRQVHVRLGEKGLRVERYALNYGGERGSSFLSSIEAEHPQLRVAQASQNSWEAWSQGLEEMMQVEQSHYYLLVDQEGFAMMLYTDQHGNDLLKDIKRALKYSIDYQ